MVHASKIQCLCYLNAVINHTCVHFLRILEKFVQGIPCLLPKGSWERLLLNLTVKHKWINYSLTQISKFIQLFYFSRLLHDRELDLFDGTRLMRWDRYQTLKEQLQFSDQQLQERYTHKTTYKLEPFELVLVRFLAVENCCDKRKETHTY